MIEIYKDIKDYEGKFQVSNLGRVMNLNYYNTGKAKLMEPFDNGHGYLQVSLYKGGKYKNCKVHRLVAQAFLPNPEDKPEINHKIDTEEGKKINIVYLNEDGSVNNEKSTIEWVTPKENCNYGSRNQRIGETSTNGKKSKKVLQFTLDGVLVKTWPSINECGRNGFACCSVCRCCRGEKPQYKGFKWCYA